LESAIAHALLNAAVRPVDIEFGAGRRAAHRLVTTEQATRTWTVSQTGTAVDAADAGTGRDKDRVVVIWIDCDLRDRSAVRQEISRRVRCTIVRSKQRRIGVSVFDDVKAYDKETVSAEIPFAGTDKQCRRIERINRLRTRRQG